MSPWSIVATFWLAVGALLVLGVFYLAYNIDEKVRREKKDGLGRSMGMDGDDAFRLMLAAVALFWPLLLAIAVRNWKQLAADSRADSERDKRKKKLREEHKDSFKKK